MKFTIPNPVTVKDPTGQDISISAQMIVEHLANTCKTLGGSQNLAKVNAAARIVEAFASPSAPGLSGELSPEDGEALTAALRNPSRGWVVVNVPVAMPTPTGEDRIVARQWAPAPLALLSLLNGLLGD